MHPTADPVTGKLRQAWWFVAQAGGLALLTGLQVCVSGNGLQAAVAPVTTSAQDQPPPLTVELSYQESSESLTWDRTVIPVSRWQLAADAVPSRKSVAKGTPRPALRGLLKLLDNPTNRMEFIWDAAAGRLSVDLNRNGDLADDPQGVLTAASTDSSGQTFTNLVVTCRESFGSYRMRLDLILGNCWPDDQVSVITELRSCYAGRMEAGGQPWQVWVGLGELSGPDIYLCPWKRGQTPDPTGKWKVRFPLTEPLFLQDTLWQLNLASAESGGSDTLKLELRLRPVELGELRLTGQYIEWLELNGTNNVLLFRPNPMVKVPTGAYKNCGVLLHKGTTYGRAFLNPREPLKVTRQQATVIDMGGPLTNCVFGFRSGGCLVIEHMIIGHDGGAPYGVANESAGGSQVPASFTVYRGSKAIGRGAVDRAPFG